MSNRNRIEELENVVEMLKNSDPSAVSNPESVNNNKIISALEKINYEFDAKTLDEYTGGHENEDEYLAFKEECDDHNANLISDALEDAKIELENLIDIEAGNLLEKLIQKQKMNDFYLNTTKNVVHQCAQFLLEERYKNLTTDGFPSVEEDIEFLAEELSEYFEQNEEKYTPPVVHKGNLNIPVNGLFRFQQIGFGKITGVGFTVYYDGDEYRDGKLSIPDGYSVLENYRDYAVERIKEIAHNDGYFSDMILDHIDTDITANGGDDNYMDVSGVFQHPETGFETSIEISFHFGESK